MRIVTLPFGLTSEELAQLQLPLMRRQFKIHAIKFIGLTAAFTVFIVLFELLVKNTETQESWTSVVRVALWCLVSISFIGAVACLLPMYAVKRSMRDVGMSGATGLAVIEIDDQFWRSRSDTGIEHATPTDLLFRLPGDDPIVVVLGNGTQLSSIPRRAFETDYEWRVYKDWVDLLPVSENLANPRPRILSPPKIQ